jgi:hypothetical protein
MREELDELCAYNLASQAATIASDPPAALHKEGAGGVTPVNSNIALAHSAFNNAGLKMASDAAAETDRVSRPVPDFGFPGQGGIVFKRADPDAIRREAILEAAGVICQLCAERVPMADMHHHKGDGYCYAWAIIERLSASPAGRAEQERKP